MFWRRKDVKLAGMLAYRKNALRAILVSLVTMIFTGVISFNMVFERVTTGTNTTDATSSMVAALTSALVYGGDIGAVIDRTNWGTLMMSLLPYSWMGYMTVGMALLAVLIYIMVAGPIEAAACHFFLKNSAADPEKPTSPRVMLNILDNYGVVIATMLLRRFLQIFFTILLIVPGVIKYYEYRMIPFLLADYKDITTREAFRLSKELMRGQKMNLFKLDLSFIGWTILDNMTSHIAGVLIVYPYKTAAMAELYQLLRDEYMKEHGLTSLV